MKKGGVVAAALAALFLSCGLGEEADKETDAKPDRATHATAAASLVVETYNPSKVYPGTTLLSDLHDAQNPRIIEVGMNGNIVWEYYFPAQYVSSASIGPDVDLLDNGNIMAIFPGAGVFELTRAGQIVWSHQTARMSHDADRLPNGDTIYVYGHNDTENDAQVTQVDSAGRTVWQWFAKDLYASRFAGVSDGGWTHINAVQRLSDGSTLVSLRNFYLTTVVDPGGALVWEFDWSVFGADTDPHEPVLLDNGHLLVCLQNDSPYQAVEVNPLTGAVLWAYRHASPLRTARDCDRLPNGNTLIVAVKDNDPTDADPGLADESTIIEVTPSGEVVWQLTLTGAPADRSPGAFFKALRIGAVYESD